MYSRLVDKCFNDCVDDFTSKSVSSREEGCIHRCWDKNMKSQERIQACCDFCGYTQAMLMPDKMRFQEQNEAMMQSGGLSQR